MNVYDAIPGLVTRDLDLTVDGQTLPVRVLEPGTLADRPLTLLTFGLGIHWGLYEEPYCEICRVFLANGHRVATWDMSSHGARVDGDGEGIVGFRNAYFAGRDPFKGFVREGKAALDLLIKNSLAQVGNIVVCGISRSAYMTLRWLAEDKRISAMTAIGPVTDWRALSEFAADADKPEMAELELRRFANDMTGVPLFIVIGNDDDRVSTTACCRFFADLFDANARLGSRGAKVRFEVRNEPGHKSPVAWYRDAAAFLLSIAATGEPK